MLNIKNTLYFLATLICFSCFEINHNTSDCKLIAPSIIEKARIDTVLRQLILPRFKIIETYVCNDSFVICYPEIKRKFELAMNYKDSLIELIEPYYVTLNRRSIDDLNFIVFYESLKKCMLNNSYDSAYKYDLGAYSNLLSNHLTFKRSKTNQEIELQQKIEKYSEIVSKLYIPSIFEVTHWKLNEEKKPIFICIQEIESRKKRKYLLYNDDSIYEMAIFN